MTKDNKEQINKRELSVYLKELTSRGQLVYATYKTLKAIADRQAKYDYATMRESRFFWQTTYSSYWQSLLVNLFSFFDDREGEVSIANLIDKLKNYKGIKSRDFIKINVIFAEIKKQAIIEKVKLAKDKTPTHSTVVPSFGSFKYKDTTIMLDAIELLIEEAELIVGEIYKAVKIPYKVGFKKVLEKGLYVTPKDDVMLIFADSKSYPVGYDGEMRFREYQGGGRIKVVKINEDKTSSGKAHKEPDELDAIVLQQQLDKQKKKLERQDKELLLSRRRLRVLRAIINSPHDREAQRELLKLAYPLTILEEEREAREIQREHAAKEKREKLRKLKATDFITSLKNAIVVAGVVKGMNVRYYKDENFDKIPISCCDRFAAVFDQINRFEHNNNEKHDDHCVPFVDEGDEEESKAEKKKKGGTEKACPSGDILDILERIEKASLLRLAQERRRLELLEIRIKLQVLPEKQRDFYYYYKYEGITNYQELADVCGGSKQNAHVRIKLAKVNAMRAKLENLTASDELEAWYEAQVKVIAQLTIPCDDYKL